MGVPADYTPHKIDTLASPARGLDRTPHVRHTAGELQGYIGEPDRDQGKKQAMADMWKRQLEMDVAAKKRAKELEEAEGAGRRIPGGKAHRTGTGRDGREA